MTAARRRHVGALFVLAVIAALWMAEGVRCGDTFFPDGRVVAPAARAER